MLRNRSKVTDVLKGFIKYVPIILNVVIILLLLKQWRSIQVEDILNYTPDNLWVASAVLISFYTLKSVIVIVPITLLYLSTGFLFPPIYAVLVNLVGLLICLIIAYYIGKLSGQELLDKLRHKYPKLDELIEQKKERNEWFFHYILRVVAPLPGDIVSMLFGALGTPFKLYITSSIVAGVPHMLILTILGVTAQNPRSPGFIVSLVLTVGIGVVSFLIYRLYSKAALKERLKED